MAVTDNATAKPKRLWRVVLVVSLALNLAVVGIIAGSIVSGRFGDGPPRSFDLGLGPMSRALEPKERRDIGRNLRENRVLRDYDLRGRIDGIVAALQAEPFDEAALRALLAEQASRVANVQVKAQDAFVAVVADMTPERRAIFAETLREELSKVRPPRERAPSGG